MQFRCNLPAPPSPVTTVTNKTAPAVTFDAFLADIAAKEAEEGKNDGYASDGSMVTCAPGSDSDLGVDLDFDFGDGSLTDSVAGTPSPRANECVVRVVDV